MPEVRYGGKRGTTINLELAKDLLVVRTRSGSSLLEGPVPRPELALINQAEMLLEFPEAGVQVFRRKPSDRRSVEDVQQVLQGSDDIRFAGRVLTDAVSGEPVVYTENVFIKFIDDLEPDECRAVLQEVGLTVKRELGYSNNAYFVAAPEGTGRKVFDIALSVLDRADVEFCHPEVVRRLNHRVIAAQQWHLTAATINGTAVNASANVAAAHAASLGEGVTIAVIDDGVDLAHEEFASSGKIVAPRDVTRGNDDPRPGTGDNHGTACAGVACADGMRASGVAPRARLMPIRFASALGSQAEADAFHWAADHGADVISCSWGPEDGDWFDPTDTRHNAVAPLPDSTRLALEYAVNNGRGGKGCVIFFAAGNGNEKVDNDGYASSPLVVAVAACNDRSRRSVYSDFGKAVFCAFPSNDFEFPEESRPAPLTRGIWTTDRSGPSGYNRGNALRGDLEGNYTNSFGGTSSSCPGAAGVAALVLSLNPNLRWDEVRDVLRRSCDQIDPQGGQYVDGRSPFYGHGRLNAETAVRLARPTQSGGDVRLFKSFNEPVRDLQTAKVVLDVRETTPLASVKAIVEIEHTWIGDLVVTLRPPSGAKIVLHDRNGGRTRDLKRTYDALNVPGLAALVGKSPTGTWTIEVKDAARDDEGMIRGFGLELSFSSPADRTAPARQARGSSKKARKAKPK